MVCHQALSTVGYCSTWLVCRCCFKTRVVVHFDKRGRTTGAFRYKRTTTALLSSPIQSEKFSRQPKHNNWSHWIQYILSEGRKINKFMHFNVFVIKFELIMVLPCLACFFIQWENKTKMICYRQDSSDSPSIQTWNFLICCIFCPRSVLLIMYICSHDCRANQYRKRWSWWASYSDQGGPPFIWKCQTEHVRHPGPWDEVYISKDVKLQSCFSMK